MLYTLSFISGQVLSGGIARAGKYGFGRIPVDISHGIYYNG